MTKEELKQEAQEWLCNNLHSASEEDFIKAMVDIAEPREKRIAELEQKLEQTEKDLADYQFNYSTIKELQKELDYQKQARSIAENAVVDLSKENIELKENNKVYCEGNGETLVVNVSFDNFTRINANHKMYYPHNNELEAQLEQEKNLSQCRLDHNEQLRELIQKTKSCKDEIIKALKETFDYEWLPAHNGKAKYVYLQTVIDVVNEKFKEIKEK